MRYEKRVARNRFIALTAFFLALLTGIVWWYYRSR
jgi:cbb3-type cytochrome oxidase subunit 3